MITRLLLFSIFSIGLFSQTAESQKSSKRKNCYSDKPFDKEKVFTKMLHKPYFIGRQDSLLNYLMSNINFQKIIADLSQYERTYTDTARVKFIVSKEGRLSDLFVTSSKKKVFSEEIIRVIKKSSCNWGAGGTERLFNVWLQFDIIYLLDRRYNEISTKVKIKEYEHATD